MKKKVVTACSVISCLILLGAIFAANLPQKGVSTQEKVKGKIDDPVKRELTEKPKAIESVITMANLEINNDLQKYGIEIIGPSDPRFDVELKRSTGDSKQELAPLIKVARLFSVIIVNNSEKEVVGVGLKWELSTPKGTNAFPQIQSTPGKLMGIRPRDPRMEGRTSLISARDAKLFSYDGTVDQVFQNVKINRGNDQHLASAVRFQSDDTLLQTIEGSKKNLLNGLSRFSVSIDGIFFSDGTFAGNDSFFFFDSMRGEVEAHLDLISLLSESASQDAISETLTDYSTRNGGRRRRPNRPESPEAAFQQGYDSTAGSLAEEISRRRTKFTDQVIANDYLVRQDPKKVVLRKLK
jgi:hypothetical protein